MDGELHAGKWADDTLHAASLGRKVSDRSCMAEPILMYQGAGERHWKSEMLSGDHGCAVEISMERRSLGLRGTVPVGFVPAPASHEILRQTRV